MMQAINGGGRNKEHLSDLSAAALDETVSFISMYWSHGELPVVL